MKKNYRIILEVEDYIGKKKRIIDVEAYDNIDAQNEAVSQLKDFDNEVKVIGVQSLD